MHLKTSQLFIWYETSYLSNHPSIHPSIYVYPFINCISFSVFQLPFCGLLLPLWHLRILWIDNIRPSNQLLLNRKIMSFTILLPIFVLLLDGQNWAGCWPFRVEWKKGYSWPLGASGISLLPMVFSSLEGPHGLWANITHPNLYSEERGPQPGKVEEVWSGWGLIMLHLAWGLTAAPDVLGKWQHLLS